MSPSPSPKKKPARNPNRYQATAKLGTYKLGNANSPQSIEIEPERATAGLGTFRVSRFGIHWADKQGKDHRASWRELAGYLGSK